MASGSIAIKFGRLTQPLQRLTAKEGATLGEFLEKHSIEYTSSIRVNGDTATLKTVLHNGDVITDIDNIEGGK